MKGHIVADGIYSTCAEPTQEICANVRLRQEDKENVSVVSMFTRRMRAAYKALLFGSFELGLISIPKFASVLGDREAVL